MHKSIGSGDLEARYTYSAVINRINPLCVACIIRLGLTPQGAPCKCCAAMLRSMACKTRTVEPPKASTAVTYVQMIFPELPRHEKYVQMNLPEKSPKRSVTSCSVEEDRNTRQLPTSEALLKLLHVC